MTPIERIVHAIAAWWTSAPECKECGVRVEEGMAFCSAEHAEAYNDVHAW